MALHPTEKQLDDLAEDRKFAEIIKRIRAIPPEERTAGEWFHLATATMNKSDWQSPQYLAELREIPDIAKAFKATKPPADFTARMGFVSATALEHLGQYGKAIPIFQKMLKKDRHNSLLEEYLNMCMEGNRHPVDNENFRLRTQKTWEDFQKQDATIRQMLSEGKEGKNWKKGIACIRGILKHAFPKPSFSVGWTSRLSIPWMQLDAFSKTELLQVLYFVRHAPEEIQDNWTLYPGWPTGSQSEYRAILDKFPGPIDVAVVPTEDGRVNLALRCQNTDEPEFKLEGRMAARDIVRTLFGSMVETTLVASAGFYNGELQQELIPLSNTLYDLDCRHLVDMADLEALERLRFPYTDLGEPEETDIMLRVWRSDIRGGVTMDQALHEAYMDYDNGPATRLESSGAVPGFAVFPLEKDASDPKALLQELLAELDETLDEEIGIALGEAYGDYFGYLDILAFDRPAVFQAVQDLLQKHGFPWACWSSFVRLNSTIPIYPDL